MENYTYQNILIGKKQLRQLLAWSFTKYDSMQACALADELKYLGFKYASQAGISISIEDLRIPFVKNLMLKKANQEIISAEKLYLKGKITDIERFQKIIDTWSLTSESLKEQVIYYFKNYDPLNSVYIMAFSGARGNLSQVRQLVGMRGLMSDPSGEIMKLPIKKNFREGLTITDYLMSGYGARKGIVDTALKTANSGYLTRRLIDVGHDVLIREKDCLTTHSFRISMKHKNLKNPGLILGRVLNKPIINSTTKDWLIPSQTQLTSNIIEQCQQNNIEQCSIRSPLTCNLYRAICQKCYGWDLANENLVDIGEAVGILAGQSIGEPGTQLTMRTFHTGGIFTSEAREQIISPITGVIRFYKNLKTVLLRTNRGEDVLITKNSGSILLIPEDSDNEFKEIKIFRNTILFPKNNQYIIKDTVIGELLNTNKQIKTEIKPILSDNCGEIFMPRLKRKINLLNNNKLLWILAGQLYSSPKNSFINFSSDYKLNKHSHIFRTKIVNHHAGFCQYLNKQQNLYQRLVRVTSHKYSLLNAKLKKLIKQTQLSNYLLELNQSKYLIKLYQKDKKRYLQITRNQQFGTLVTNKFKTLTGGRIYYDYRAIYNCNQINQTITFFKSNSLFNKYNCSSLCRTVTWIGEETHIVDCEPNILLVEPGDFISKDFELIPGLFSKTSGIVLISQKADLVQVISIRSGLLYEGKKFKNLAKKLYYPGENLFANILVKSLSFCENINLSITERLLLRPVSIYEIPHLNRDEILTKQKFETRSIIKAESAILYSYKSNQFISGSSNLDLISFVLNLEPLKMLNKDLNIEVFSNLETHSIDFYINDKIYLNNYLVPQLRYKNISSCFIIQTKQFIDCYTTLGYLESLVFKSLEVVKFKIKNKETKQILLISNDECFTIKRAKFPNKALNEFIINGQNITETGKIIVKNSIFFTVQKGRPYFFPNCKNEEMTNQTNLEYKVISSNRLYKRFTAKKSVFLNYYDITKTLIRKSFNFSNSKFLTTNLDLKTEFSKLFLKRNGKIYSSLIPQLFKKFSINNFSDKVELENKNIIGLTNLKNNFSSILSKTILVQNSEVVKNRYKTSKKTAYNLTMLRLIEHPFPKSTKALGLYSITEDYFEQEVNSVFCKNGEFIDTGETIGLLNLEKEITGDIVQGLPRIEEILEARKKNITVKKLPTSQKKGLLVQKSCLDVNFEFKKLGTPIKETEKINPHKLLKSYFNYYGLVKFFICDRTNKFKITRLLKNYEGSYKSFKKVQSFILNSVQTVYQSQGVTINDKHLEVIIKQMTTKVLITYEGNTPLLRREVIDLYHIQYINQIVKEQGKKAAYYVPLLLGITKAALNNPSFISAASFQETTRVLTKAAIEGRIDWLRGLKENIIIGHLIPAGTGSQNYNNCFQNRNKTQSKLKL